MTLVQQISKFIDMDESEVRKNLIMLTLSDVVSLSQYMHNNNKEQVFRIISGAAV